MQLRAGLSLLKNICKPWNAFLKEWSKIKVNLAEIEKTKRIDLEERMLEYIFKSRKENITQFEEPNMGKKVLTAYERALEEEGDTNGSD